MRVRVSQRAKRAIKHGRRKTCPIITKRTAFIIAILHRENNSVTTCNSEADAEFYFTVLMDFMGWAERRWWKCGSVKVLDWEESWRGRLPWKPFFFFFCSLRKLWNGIFVTERKCVTTENEILVSLKKFCKGFEFSKVVVWRYNLLML